MGRVGFEPTITGARDQYLRPSCPHGLGGLDHRPWNMAGFLGKINHSIQPCNCKTRKEKRRGLYFAVLARAFFEVSLGVLVRSLLDFAECGGGCFHGSVEVSPDEALEEYADGPGSPIVEFVDFLSDKYFCLVS